MRDCHHLLIFYDHLLSAEQRNPQILGGAVARDGRPVKLSPKFAFPGRSRKKLKVIAKKSMNFKIFKRSFAQNDRNP